MGKWIRSYDSEEFDSEEAARDAAAECVDIDDIVAQVDNELTTWDLIKELERLNSPLYYDLCDKAIEQVLEDCFFEIEEDEEEEEEEEEDDPYAVTNPMAFY